jgi:hypothetical protein
MKNKDIYILAAYFDMAIVASASNPFATVWSRSGRSGVQVSQMR